VRVTIVPSSVGGKGVLRTQFLTSYLVNDTVAIDAGSLGFYRTPKEQAQVKHLFLSHSHLDHVASLPAFLDNTYDPDGGDPVTVYGGAETLECLRRDLFNDRLWPNFLQPPPPRPPFLKLRLLEPGVPVSVAGLRLTPVPVCHAVPTLGFIVEEPGSTVVFPSDTGPTEEIWVRSAAVANLRAVFLEACFPNEMAWLAELARHLTPALFAAETAKLKQPATFIAVHVHPRHRGRVVKQLRALGLSNLQIGQFGVPYEF
jgi:ribonuclease BN (tRNA processing enzyme)